MSSPQQEIDILLHGEPKRVKIVGFHPPAADIVRVVVIVCSIATLFFVAVYALGRWLGLL